MNDLAVLLRLRWWQVRGAGGYWLRVIGYETSDTSFLHRVYGVYLGIVLVGIGLLGWSEALGAVGAFGQRVAAQPGLAGALPLVAAVVVLVLLVVRAGMALASSPLKLTLPEIAFVAGSPLRGPAMVLAALLRGLALTGLLVAATGALAAVVYSGTYRHELAGAAAAVVLLLTARGLAWALGMARLTLARPWRVGLWLVPAIIAAVLLLALPAAALWPGHTVDAAMGRGTVVPALLLLALAVAAGVVAVLLGRRVNMTDVADESALYAQLATLGNLAWFDPSLAQEMRQRALQSRRRATWALPDATGWHLVLARVGLAYLRRPGQALLLVRDVALTFGGCWVLFGGGRWPWFDWVLLMAVIPPRGVADRFEANVREPFLRQFLPQSDLSILGGDVLGPAALVLAAAIVLWALVHPAGATLVQGIVAIIVILALRIACQGVAPSRSRGGRWRPPFVLVAGLAFLFVMLLGVRGHDPSGGLILGLCVTGLLALILAAV